MKESISKPLVFSFFLIGIILAMVLLDAGVVELPVLGESSVEAPLTVEDEAQAKGGSVTGKTAAMKRDTGKAAEQIAPQPAPEPLICDQAEAQAVRDKAREIALIVEQGDLLSVTLRDAWAFYTPGIRRSFVERFVASDLCLSGKVRAIHFFFRGQTVAVADGHGSIELKLK